jgi:cyanate permease
MFASLPFAYKFVRPKRPEYYGLLPDGALPETVAVEDKVRASTLERGGSYTSSVHETEYSFKQVRKTRVFWLLTLIFCANYIISGGFNVHAIPFMTDIGFSESAAGGLMGMMIFFSVPSRFFGGLIGDRVPKNRVHFLLLGTFLLQAIGTGTYLLLGNTFSVYTLLVFHGLSSGVVTPLILMIIGRFFGRKAFGSILGAMVAFGSSVGTLAPVYYGWIYDTTGSYNGAFITAFGLAVMSVIAMLFVKVPQLSGTPN